MPDVRYEIVQSIACLSEENKGWTNELNMVSWNGGPPKYDLRAWSSDHSQMGKGITLTMDELIQLASVLQELL